MFGIKSLFQNSHRGKLQLRVVREGLGDGIDEWMGFWEHDVRSLKGILLVLHADLGWNAVFLKEVVAGFEVFPEVEPWVVGGFLHAFFGHAEGENMDTEERLSVIEGRLAEGVDFLDFSSVMARQPMETLEPCTMMNEPVRPWARS